MATKKDEGFTLVEIVTVLVVLGIISSFVIRGIGETSPRQVVQQEATRVTSLIAEARAAALSEQVPVRMDVIGGKQLRLRHHIRGGWSSRKPATSVRDGVGLTINGGASGFLEFLPTGAVRAPATIEVAGRSRVERVAVWASGMTRRSRQ